MGLGGPTVITVVWGSRITVEARLIVVQAASPSVGVCTTSLPVERLPCWGLWQARIACWKVWGIYGWSCWPFWSSPKRWLVLLGLLILLVRVLT